MAVWVPTRFLKSWQQHNDKTRLKFCSILSVEYSEISRITWNIFLLSLHTTRDISTPRINIQNFWNREPWFFCWDLEILRAQGGMNVKQPEIVQDCTYFFIKQNNWTHGKGRTTAVIYLQTDGKRHRELYTMKYNEMDPIQQVTASRLMRAVVPFHQRKTLPGFSSPSPNFMML